MRTDGVFKTKLVRLNNWKAGKTLQLIPFGDIHHDSPAHAEDEFKRFIDYAKRQKNALFLGMGDYCIPMRGEILTRRGFVKCGDLSVGEEVLAFDSQSGVSRWTPLLGIYLSPQQRLISLKSKSFSAQCTPSHAWYAKDHYKRTVRVETKVLKTSHKIIVAAPCGSDGNNNISDSDAAMLGWIVTDGHCRKSNRYAVSVAQSERNCLSEIVALFGNMVTGVYKGRSNDCSTVNISRKSARALFDRTQFSGKDSLPKIACGLSLTARKAMLSAMLNAEGWQERGHWRFAQKEGPVLEAFEILSTLSGFRLGKRTRAKNGVVSVRLVSPARQIVGVADLKIAEVPGLHDSWCPMTQYRSFVMRLDGQISITGNTDSFSTSERAIIYDNRLHESTRKREEQQCKGRVQRLADKLGFMRGRLIGLIGGNHFPVFADGTTGDQLLAEKLGTFYLGSCCAIRLAFARPGTNAKTACDIFAHHGKGGGVTAGGKFNAVEKLQNVCDADIFLMGDNHARGCFPAGDRLYLTHGGKGALSVKSKTRWLGRTGSFLRGYVENESSYVVDGAMSPANLGWIEFLITPMRPQESGGDAMTIHIGAKQ